MSIGHLTGPAETPAAENLPHLQGMGRRQRRAAETRLRLFRSALQLFAERGFANVRVEEITEAADVGKGTFFNYFESKDHVLGVMAEIQLGKVREALALAPLPLLGKDVLDRGRHGRDRDDDGADPVRLPQPDRAEQLHHRLHLHSHQSGT